MRKFPEPLFRNFIVGTRRIFGSWKHAEIFILPICTNLCPPFPALGMPRHPLESTAILSIGFFVLAILGVRALPKIFFTVVERIVIFVVSLLPRCTSQNQRMHRDRMPFDFSAGVKTSGVRCPMCNPIPLRKPLKIFGIHNGILALRKWNIFERLVERLDNCMSFHAVFHWPSFKGLLKFSRHFITFLLLLLLSISASATTTVTGTLQNLGTGTVGQGAFVRFWLRGCAGNQPRVAGTALIAPSQGGVFFFDLPANASGAVSGTLYSTRDSTGLLGGDITCGTVTTGVWYGMQVFVGGKGGPEIPIHAKNGVPLNISSVIPITTNPVVTAPTGDSTYCRLDGATGNCPSGASSSLAGPGSVTGNFTGGPTLSGTWNFAGGIIVTTANFTGAGTHSGTETFSGLLNAKNFEGMQFCDQFAGATADVQITAAIAALPANGGTVDCRGYGATTQTIAATVNVGSTSKTVTLLLDRSTNFQCTITGGTSCWHLAEGSSIFSIGEVPSAAGNGGFSASNSAVISNMLLVDTGATGNIAIQNLQILSNASTTVSDSVVKIVNGAGVIRGLTVQGFSNTVLLKITQTAGQFVGPLTIDNPQINCGALTGCKPVLVQAVASGGVMLGVNFVGGSISHPGSGGLALVDLQGITGGDCSGVNIFGTQLESSNTTDVGININNCTGVFIQAPAYTSAAAIGKDAVKISGANSNGIRVDGVNNFNNWTNNINNVANGRVYTNANNHMGHYSYCTAGATCANDYVFDTSTGLSAVIDTNGFTLSRVMDVNEIAAPANPAAGFERWYANSSTHQLSCLNSAGGNCILTGNSAVYSTPSASTNASIGATTMATAGGSGNTYRFSGYADGTVAGTGCSGNGSLSIGVTYTDANGGGAISVTLLLETTVGTTVTSATITTGGGPGTPLVTILPFTIRAAAGSVVQYSTGYAAGSGCSVGPKYQVFPILEQLN